MCIGVRDVVAAASRQAVQDVDRQRNGLVIFSATPLDVVQVPTATSATLPGTFARGTSIAQAYVVGASGALLLLFTSEY